MIGAKVNNPTVRFGTALTTLAYYAEDNDESVDMLNFFMRNGADVNASWIPDIQGIKKSCAFFLLVEKNKIKLLRALLDYNRFNTNTPRSFDINLVNEEGTRALGLAIGYDPSGDVMELLLANDALLSLEGDSSAVFEGLIFNPKPSGVANVILKNYSQLPKLGDHPLIKLIYRVSVLQKNQEEMVKRISSIAACMFANNYPLSTEDVASILRVIRKTKHIDWGLFYLKLLQHISDRLKENDQSIIFSQVVFSEINLDFVKSSLLREHTALIYMRVIEQSFLRLLQCTSSDNLSNNQINVIEYAGAWQIEEEKSATNNEENSEDTKSMKNKYLASELSRLAMEIPHDTHNLNSVIDLLNRAFDYEKKGTVAKSFYLECTEFGRIVSRAINIACLDEYTKPEKAFLLKTLLQGLIEHTECRKNATSAIYFIRYISSVLQFFLFGVINTNDEHDKKFIKKHLGFFSDFFANLPRKIRNSTYARLYQKWQSLDSNQKSQEFNNHHQQTTTPAYKGKREESASVFVLPQNNLTENFTPVSQQKVLQEWAEHTDRIINAEKTDNFWKKIFLSRHKRFETTAPWSQKSDSNGPTAPNQEELNEKDIRGAFSQELAEYHLTDKDEIIAINAGDLKSEYWGVLCWDNVPKKLAGEVREAIENNFKKAQFTRGGGGIERTGNEIRIRPPGTWRMHAKIFSRKFPGNVAPTYLLIFCDLKDHEHDYDVGKFHTIQPASASRPSAATSV